MPESQTVTEKAAVQYSFTWNAVTGFMAQTHFFAAFSTVYVFLFPTTHEYFPYKRQVLVVILLCTTVNLVALS